MEHVKDRWLFAALCLAVLCAYLNHFQNGFHFDDYHAVTDNPYVRDVHNAGRFFTDATTFSVLKANQTYRPVVSASLAIDYAVGGGYVPLWFHVSTFLIFLAQLAAMFVLLAALLTKVRDGPTTSLVAAFATAWYGLHPAIAETVNYVIQRADVYSTCGVVAGLAIYARLPRLRTSGLYLLPVAIGLLAKPTAVVFPLLLLLYVWYFDERFDLAGLRAAAARAAPALLLSAAALVLQSAMTPKSFAPTALSAQSYLATQPYVLLRYFTAFFFPFHLSADSDLAAIAGFGPEAVIGCAFVAALIAGAWWTARRAEFRPVSFGLAWFLVASLPTSVYPLAELENDHRMYFPFVGLVLAVTWGCALVVAGLSARADVTILRRSVALAAVAVLAAYGYGTHVRNETWRTEESLWRDVTQKSPHNGRGLMNYGLTQMRLGRDTVALEYFERASVFVPNYPALEINLGVANGDLRRGAEAERHFRRAIALAPGDDQTHFYYARWLREVGRSSESLAEAGIAYHLNPAVPSARTLLMRDLLDDGRRPEARTVAAETLRLIPADPDARAVMAEPADGDAPYWLDVSFKQYNDHRYLDCIASARHALRLKPAFAEAYNNIGAAFQSLHRWDDAIAADRRALQLAPHYQLAKNNLAWSLAQKRRAAR